MLCRMYSRAKFITWTIFWVPTWHKDIYMSSRWSFFESASVFQWTQACTLLDLPNNHKTWWACHAYVRPFGRSQAWHETLSTEQPWLYHVWMPYHRGRTVLHLCRLGVFHEALDAGRLSILYIKSRRIHFQCCYEFSTWGSWVVLRRFETAVNIERLLLYAKSSQRTNWINVQSDFDDVKC